MTLWQRLRNRLDRFDEHWGAELAASLAVPATTRYGLVWVPLAALGLALLLGLSPFRPWLADGLHDASLRAVARQAHYRDVLVVDIDDASLRVLQPRLGNWPYSRDTYAMALNYLRELGARAVVFDIVLSDSRPGDAALAQALAGRRDVVLAAAGLRRAADPDISTAALRRSISLAATPLLPATAWPGMSLPTEVLLAALASSAGPGAIGMISTPLDPDGLLRRLPLLHLVDERIYPSLALAAQVLLPPEPGLMLQPAAGALHFGKQRWPVDDRGRVTLLLPQNADAVPTLSFSNLMAGALGLSEGAGLREVVAGRTVFVGSTAFLADEVRTPVGSRSGSALLATAHAALRRGEVLQQPGPAWSMALFGVALLPSLWLWQRRRPVLVRDALASLAAWLGLLLLGLGALVLTRTEFDLLLPLACVLFGFVIAAALQLRWVGLANQRLEVERAVADAANRAKSELLANVSHEIRTPLNALLGVAELLQRTPLNAEQRRFVEVFRLAGQTLFELINDLLDLAKAEAGQLALVQRPFSLQQMLAELQALMATRAFTKGLVLEWQAAPDLPDWVLGDRRRLAQVLTNLVGNAIKFTPAGRVLVQVASAPDGIRFSVGDTGIGIPDTEQRRIFEPFVQADGSSTRAQGGTGLGLSISSSLVRQMGGHIELQSAPDAGSTFAFCIRLPAAPVSPSDPAPPAEAAPRHGAGSTLRVLLTEDNEVNALLIEAMLRDCSVAIDRALDGRDAIERWRVGRYDVVLMDVQMPGLDGHAATREIRRIEAAEGREPTPVIALTAHAYPDDAQRSFDAGCNGHLTKPIARETLLAALAPYRSPQER